MVNENLNKSRSRALKMYGVFVVITLALIFLFLAIFSAVSVIFNVDKSMVPLFSALSLCFATLIGAYLAGRAFGGKSLIVGGINGLLLYLLVCVSSAIINNGRLTLSSLFNFLIILFSSLVGAVFGANSANKRKIK